MQSSQQSNLQLTSESVQNVPDESDQPGETSLVNLGTAERQEDSSGRGKVDKNLAKDGSGEDLSSGSNLKQVQEQEQYAVAAALAHTMTNITNKVDIPRMIEEEDENKSNSQDDDSDDDDIDREDMVSKADQSKEDRAKSMMSPETKR